MEKTKFPGFHKTVRFKIVFIFSTTFIVISLLTSLWTYSVLARLVTEQDNSRLLTRAESLTDKLEISPLIIPLPEKDEQVRFSYYGRDFDTILFQSPHLVFSQLPDTNAVISDNGNRVVRFVKNTENSTSDWIELTMVTSDTLTTTLRNIRLNISLTILFSALISSLFAYFVSGLLLRPIQKIISKTDSIDLSKKPELIELSETGDELHQLTDTINRLLVRINETLSTQNSFFAAAAHELRTPLTIMQTELEVTGMNQNLDESTVSLIQSQLAEVKRLSRLVEDFLTMSQSRHDIVKLNNSDVDIVSLASDAINRMAGLAMQSNTRLILNRESLDKDFIVRCDRSKMMSVLLNLIDNAIKYNAGFEPITIVVFRDASRVTIGVRNKTNQNLAQLHKLKDDFFQGGALNEGFGLGLWISNQLIELQDGKLDLVVEDGYFKALIHFG